MAETLNKYATEEAYQAESHADSLDEVSLVTTTGDVHFDGHNVYKPATDLKVGDAVYVTANGTKYYIDGASLDASSLDSGMYPCGVVVTRSGKVSKMLHWNIITRGGPFVSAFTWKLVPNGQPIKFSVVKLNSSGNPSNATVDMPSTFTATKDYATDLAGYTAELDTWLRANQPKDASIDAVDYKWHAAVMADHTGTPGCYIISDNVGSAFGSYITLTSCASGGTLTTNMYGKETAQGHLARKNGTNAGFAGYNKHYILSFYSTNAGRAPTANMTNTTYGFVAKTYFDNSEYCAGLRAEYGTWQNYVDSIMLANLVSGNQAKMGGRELTNSRWMAQQQVTYLDGTTGNLFPAGYYSVNPDTQAIVNSSFEWHMPSVPEAYMAFSGEEILPDGIINTTLVKMGGPAWVWANGTYYWLSSKVNNTREYELNENGRAGMFDYYNIGNTNRYLSVADIN